jgi:hypothetical protein
MDLGVVRFLAVIAVPQPSLNPRSLDFNNDTGKQIKVQIYAIFGRLSSNEWS